MNNNENIRKLPKKTIIIIGILIFIGIFGFFFLKSLKEQKLEEILESIGYKNISQLQVINRMEVEDNDTRLRSTVYKIVFYNEDTKQNCIGFVHKEKDAHYTKDFDCK